VSVLSSGILALKRTLVGVVHIDPKRLLEEVRIQAKNEVVEKKATSSS
jgi:hypothetical protein